MISEASTKTTYQARFYEPHSSFLVQADDWSLAGWLFRALDLLKVLFDSCELLEDGVFTSVDTVQS